MITIYCIVHHGRSAHSTRRANVTAPGMVAPGCSGRRPPSPRLSPLNTWRARHGGLQNADDVFLILIALARFSQFDEQSAFTYTRHK